MCIRDRDRTALRESACKYLNSRVGASTNSMTRAQSAPRLCRSETPMRRRGLRKSGWEVIQAEAPLSHVNPRGHGAFE
eukprot:1534683-Alexandrium_andersonii.AAC.1